MIVEAVRNPAYNAFGTIDMEIDHPRLGWIPFTADSNDIEQLGRDLFAAALAGQFGQIAAYVQPLEDAQAQQIDLIEADYLAANYAPIDYMNTTFQADQASQDLIASVITASDGTLPANFAWYDINNVSVPMTYQDLQGFAAAILSRGQPLFVHKQTQKAAIRAATTVAEVEAVTW